VRLLAPVGLADVFLFDAGVTAIAGLALGLFVGFVLSRGDRVPIWPALSYVAGVVAFGFYVLYEWMPAGGSPVLMDYVRWALVTLVPVVGVGAFLLLKQALPATKASDDEIVLERTTTGRGL
jgi:hypothetical protein